MPHNKQLSFKCKNYHKLSKKELTQYVDKIKWWLFNYPNNPKRKKVEFALEVALSAQENKDDLFDELIDNLT